MYNQKQKEIAFNNSYNCCGGRECHKSYAQLYTKAFAGALIVNK